MSRQRRIESEAVPIKRIEASLRHVARLAQGDPVYLPIFRRLLSEHEAAKARLADTDLVKAWAA